MGTEFRPHREKIQHYCHKARGQHHGPTPRDAISHSMHSAQHVLQSISENRTQCLFATGYLHHQIYTFRLAPKKAPASTATMAIFQQYVQVCKPFPTQYSTMRTTVGTAVLFYFCAGTPWRSAALAHHFICKVTSTTCSLTALLHLQSERAKAFGVSCSHAQSV